MRAILDTNTLISMAITPLESSTTMWWLMRHAMNGVFEPILLEQVVNEYHQAIRRKPYLRRTISSDRADRFISDLRSISEFVPEIDLPASLRSRDEDDDFLLAYALMLNVDYLVTGDRDLLVLRGAINLIVSPAEFLALIETETEDSE